MSDCEVNVSEVSLERASIKIAKDGGFIGAYSSYNMEMVWLEREQVWRADALWGK